MKDEVFQQFLLISATAVPLIIFLKLLGNKLSKCYVSKWKYYIWLVLAVRLLIPWSPELPVQPLEIVMREETLVMQEEVADVFNILQPPDVSDFEQGQISYQSELDSDVSAAEVNQQNAWSRQDIWIAVKRLWVAGAVLYVGYHLAANVYASRRLCRWSRLPKDEILLQIQEALGVQKFPKHLQIRMNAKMTGPMIAGVLRPKLYLPERFFEKEELRLILLHELIHYRRKDLWYKLLLLWVNGIHWFNPFVYMMCREAEKDLEYSCDSAVMCEAEKETRCHYANLILNEAACRRSEWGVLTSNFYGGKDGLKRRMQNILDMRKKKRGAASFGILTAVVVLGSGLWNFSWEKSLAQEYSEEIPGADTAWEQLSSGEIMAENRQEAVLETWLTENEREHSVNFASTKYELLEELEGLMLDGSGSEDKLMLYRGYDGEMSYNVLSVQLGSGLTASYELPSNYADVSDNCYIYHLPLQSPYYQSIIVRLSDPKVDSVNAGTDFYILHVEVDEETQTARLVEDVAILDEMTNSPNYAAHRDTFLGMPFYHVTCHWNSGPDYHEDLGKATLHIKGYSENASESGNCYVYWDGEDWKTYVEF